MTLTRQPWHDTEAEMFGVQSCQGMQKSCNAVSLTCILVRQICLPFHDPAGSRDAADAVQPAKPPHELAVLQVL